MICGNILGTVDGKMVSISEELREEISRLSQRSRTSVSLIADSILDEVEARLGWILSECDQFLIIFDDNRLTLRAVALTNHSIYIVHVPQHGGGDK
jgi:hypothetical protein